MNLEEELATLESQSTIMQQPVNNVNTKIAKKLLDMNVYSQRSIDYALIKLDGSQNKSTLGANATLGVSLACCKAAANSLGLPLYSYIGGVNAHTLPTPMMNILNGGKHSDNNINILLKSKNLSTAVGDEGGFAPNLQSNEEALDLIVEAIKVSNYKLKTDIAIALDIAGTEMFDEAKKQNKDGYLFWKTNEFKTKEEMISQYDFLKDIKE